MLLALSISTSFHGCSGHGTWARRPESTRVRYSGTGLCVHTTTLNSLFGTASNLLGGRYSAIPSQPRLLLVGLRPARSPACSTLGDAGGGRNAFLLPADITKITITSFVIIVGVTVSGIPSRGRDSRR